MSTRLRYPAFRSRRQFTGRAALAFACVVALIWPTSVSAVASAFPASLTSTSASVPISATPQEVSAAAVAAAQQQAVESGEPVVVDELTTPIELTTALPDGTVEYEASTRPVRVEQGGAWVPVDLGLVRDGDWFEPKATAVPVRFGVGGSDALAQVQTETGEWVSEIWPHGTLPAPVIDADTATYGDVFPGVDLKLVATKTGLASVYVVESAAAAQSLALSDLHVIVEGADLSLTSSGNVRAEATDGSRITSGNPFWWDSSEGSTYREPQGVEGPLPVVHEVEPDRVSMDVGDSVTQHETASGDVTYPIFVDPDWSAGEAYSWYTDAAYPNASYLSAGASDVLRVGIYEQYRSDMFFQFPLSSMSGKQILSAQLSTTQIRTAASGAQAIQVHTYGPKTAGFTWAQEQSWNAAGTGGWSGVLHKQNPLGSNVVVGWNVMAGVKAKLGAANIQFAFTYSSPTAPSRRHYDRDATLRVSYNTPPGAPTGAKFSSPDRPCGTAASPTMIGQSSVTVVVDQRDPDPGNVDTNFYLASASNLSAILQRDTGGLAAQGLKYGTFTGLSDATYAWRARGSDWKIDGTAYSPWCYFTVDTTAPALPALSLASGPNIVGEATTATITVNPSDGVDFVAYVVSAAPVSEPFTFQRFTNRPACGAVQGLVRIACPNSTGTANVTFAPADAASTLWAVSYDKAGNPSVEPGYPAGTRGASEPVTATNSASVAYATGHVWRTQPMASPLSESIPDSHASAPVELLLGRDTLRTLRANPLMPTSSLVKPVLGFADPATTGLTGSDFSATAAPVAAFAGSYAVAAWLKPASATAGTALGVGTNSTLRLSASSSAWEFCVPTSTASACVSTPLGTVDEWVHVAGVVDRVNGQLRVYLDGALAATAALPSTAPNIGTGTVDIGVRRSGGTVTARWPGQIADVAIFGGIPTSSQLSTLRLGADPAEG